MRPLTTLPPERSRLRHANALMYVLSGAIFLYGGAARAETPKIVKGPYLQALASDAVELRAELASPAPITVTVTPPSGSDAGAARTVRDAVASAMHVVRIDGLEPATRYAYSVASGAEVERGSFVTAPKTDSTDPFNFVVYGDNRTDDVAHAAVVHAILPAAADFLIHTGDFVQDGADGEMWQSFFDAERPLLRDKCVFACVGNHEITDGQGENYLRYFGPTSDAHGVGEKPKLYGSFRWATARFFLLDAMESFDEGPERQWLDDELARADGESGLKWRIVVLHQGPWSAGPHGGNPRLQRAGIPDLLARHKVDLVIAGHDHIYERGYANSLRYLISGGGGAPLYPIRELTPATKKVESVHHFVEVSVKPDAIAIVARRDDGSVLDKCGFAHGGAPGWDCDPPAPAAKTASKGAPSAPLASASSGSRCGCAVPGAARESPAWLVPLVIGLLLRGARRRYSRSRCVRSSPPS